MYWPVYLPLFNEISLSVKLQKKIEMIVIMFETHLKINDTITANGITADMIICGSCKIATSDSNTATNKSNKD